MRGADDTFGELQLMTALAERDDLIKSVVVSDDDMHIFFSIGGVIHAARRPEAGQFFGPFTPLWDAHPDGATEGPSWISPDGCRLYFHSDRPGGAGGQDIWMASRTPR